MVRIRKGIGHGIFVWLVIFTGYGIFGALLKQSPPDIDLWREYALLIALGVLAEWFTVSVPQGSLSLGFAVAFLSFIRFDTTITVLVTALSAFIANSIFTRGGFFRTTVFNGAQFTISAFAASVAYLYAGGQLDQKISLANTPALLIFIAAYFIVNHLLVTLYLWPTFRLQFWNMWRSAVKWDFFTYLFAAPVGILMALIYEKIGALGAVLLFIPLLTIKYLFRLYINLEMANKELSALYEVARNLGASLDLAKTLGVILREAKRVVNYHTGVIYLWDEESRVMVPTAIRSPYDEQLKGIVYPLGEGIVGHAAQTGQPVIVYDAQKDRSLQGMPGLNRYLRSLLVVPLKLNDKLIGVVAVGKKEPYGFGPKQMQIMTSLGGQAAVAMENALLYKKIEKLAVTDGLTKVYNHRYFYKRIDEEAERSRRYRTVFSLLMLDLDYFKRLNDTYGHRAGDLVLSTVADIIKENTRSIDVISRYGGEEFAVIMPGTDAAQARLVAERIRRAINEAPIPVAEGKPPIGITVSIGITTCPQDATDPAELIEKADKALYYSKRTGRNKVSVWAELPVGAITEQ